MSAEQPEDKEMVDRLLEEARQEKQEEPVQESAPIAPTPAQSPVVTLSADQFNQLMSQMQSLSQQVDFLKNQAEASQAASKERVVPDADSEEAVMHTLSRIRSAKEVAISRTRSKADEVVELAIDYAIANFIKNPPKHRGKE